MVLSFNVTIEFGPKTLAIAERMATALQTIVNEYERIAAETARLRQSSDNLSAAIAANQLEER